MYSTKNQFPSFTSASFLLLKIQNCSWTNNCNQHASHLPLEIMLSSLNNNSQHINNAFTSQTLVNTDLLSKLPELHANCLENHPPHFRHVNTRQHSAQDKMHQNATTPVDW